MPAVAATGEISYNGVALGVMTVTENVRITPVESADRRLVTHVTYFFTFRTTFAGSGTSAAVLNARRKLMEHGRVFKYIDKGMDLSINTSTVKDILWGPKTRETSWVPTGDGRAWDLVWTLEVSLPACADARFTGPMSLVYSVTFDVSRDGFTDRHITGFLKVPQSLIANGTRLSDSPDYYRERLVPILLPGFRRVYGPWTVSEDRTQLHFSITDEELGRNIAPPGVIEVKSSHRVSSNVKGCSTWVGVITAAYTLEKQVRDIYLPARHFFGVLVKDRITATADALKKGDSKAIVPLGIELQEPNIHGRENIAHFSFTYSFVRALKDGILTASSLWRSDPSSNWRLWSAAIQNSALHPRGYAKLVFDVGDDQGAVSLCKPSDVSITTARGPAANYLPYGPRPIGAQGPKEGDLAELIRSVVPAPTAERSYSYYENEIWIEADSGTVPAVTLPSSPLTSDNDLFGNVADAVGKAVDAYKDFSNRMPPTVAIGRVGGRIENDTIGDVQRRSRPLCVVWMIGKSTRYGFPVACPRLLSVDGMKPVPALRLDRGEGFGQKITFNAGDHPVYSARWALRYILPRLPEGPIPVPPNPILSGG